MKKSSTRPALIPFFALLLTFFSTASLAQTEPPPVFSFTAIPDQDQTRLNSRFNALANYLTEKLGVQCRFVAMKSYPAAVIAFRSNQVQLGWFGGLSGVRARQLTPGAKAIAQGAEDKTFRTFFIAHHLSGLKASDDFPNGLAGKTFTFGSKSSTSGRLMPDYYIRQHSGKSPAELFQRVGFSGDHSRTIALVQSGIYQLGAVNFKVWENEFRAGKIDMNKISVIWITPPYPDYQWTLRGDVDQIWGDGFEQRVRQTILSLKDPEILASFPRSSFIPASNDDYLPILNIGREIGLIDQP